MLAHLKIRFYVDEDDDGGGGDGDGGDDDDDYRDGYEEGMTRR